MALTLPWHATFARSLSSAGALHTLRLPIVRPISADVGQADSRRSVPAIHHLQHVQASMQVAEASFGRSFIQTGSHGFLHANDYYAYGALI